MTVQIFYYTSKAEEGNKIVILVSYGRNTRYSYMTNMLLQGWLQMRNFEV